MNYDHSRQQYRNDPLPLCLYVTNKVKVKVKVKANVDLYSASS